MSKPLSVKARIATAEGARAEYLSELRELQEDNKKRLKLITKVDEFAERITAKFVAVMQRFDDHIEGKKKKLQAEIDEANAYLDGEVK